MKTLLREREGIDAEWEKGGALRTLAETGVLGTMPRKTANERRPSTAPGGRGVAKRPTVARVSLRAMHGKPFKAQNVTLANNCGGGAVVETATSSVKKQCPRGDAGKPILSHGRNNDHEVIVGSQKVLRDGLSGATRAGDSAAPQRPVPEDGRPASRPVGEGKENSFAPIVTTPVRVACPPDPLRRGERPVASVAGTPVVALLARGSPGSAERLRDTGDVFGTVLGLLRDEAAVQQALGVRALALFAKEEPWHRDWEGRFPVILECLLGTRSLLDFSRCQPFAASISGSAPCSDAKAFSLFFRSDHISRLSTVTVVEPALDFLRSPGKKHLLPCHQLQHLFLHAVRALLQFVPRYVTGNQVKDIVCSMLEVRLKLVVLRPVPSCHHVPFC